MSKSLLIVEDEETLRESLKRIFVREGFTVDVAASAEQALPLADDSSYDVVISDIILPGMDGIEMLGRMREARPDQLVVIITAYASLDTSVRALRAGAYDYILKPIMHEEIIQVVHNAIRQQQLRRENRILRRQVEGTFDFSRIVGQSPPMRAVLDQVRRVADSRSNVLLLGQTGTGKELFARVIHSGSSRASMPFVPINCSAIPEQLLESELFGHVKGAFTGASAGKLGLFEEADGGTVFLDEIGDMPLNFQVKLLRVIEDHEIRMVGSTKTKKIDLRFITATNRELAAAVAAGTFREDLYYRINVITIELPPLKARGADVRALAEHFLARIGAEAGKAGLRISDEAMGVIEHYAWPGNIRELQNVVERAVLLTDTGAIGPEHLPENIHRRSSFADAALEQGMSIEEYTRSFIARYQATCGEQEMADRLGITRKTLWEKRKKWGMKKHS
jgi:DNA-binding NtrC family response regulator